MKVCQPRKSLYQLTAVSLKRIRGAHESGLSGDEKLVSQEQHGATVL